MKIIHFESGLGNQMLQWCVYLAQKEANPNDSFYAETFCYDIPECNDVIRQWNGYELERIFGLKLPNIKELFSDSEWQKIMCNVRKSEFWNHKWNYGIYVSKALRGVGMDLEYIGVDLEKPGAKPIIPPKNTSGLVKVKEFLNHHFYPYTCLHEYIMYKRAEKLLKNANYSYLFKPSNKNLYIPLKLDFCRKNSGIEKIERKIKDAFRFPEVADENNIAAMDFIKTHNTVAIHARRGDMLGINYGFYATGYFRKAVKYIRQQVADPVFCIFCDPSSVQWVKDHPNIFGLHPKTDKIYFIDWNKGTESFRDMQLMAACKHQVITNSTFGWWGAFLNENPNKITCSPIPYINTTHTF